MNKKFKSFIHSRLFIIILISVLILTTLLFGTYAWFTWSSTDTDEGNTLFTMTVGEIADVFFTDGNAIDGQLNPVFNYYDGLSTSFSIDTRSTPSSGDKYNILFNITSIDEKLISEDVKYVVVKDDEVVSEGDLSSASSGGTIRLYGDTFELGTVNYDIYFYIDGNVENDSDMMDKSIVGNITVVLPSGPTLKDYIYNLYNTTTQTKVSNGLWGGYITYANNGYLFNDMLDETGAATDIGNIRYSGAESDYLNNYIYFNCDEYPSTNCETWRILGIIDGKVKLVRSAPIGGYAYDSKQSGIGSSTSSTGSSDWSDARLMMLLNPVDDEQLYDSSGNLIYSETPSLYWNAGSGNCYAGANNATTPCDFTNTTGNTTIGIKNNTTRSMIATSNWYYNYIINLSINSVPNVTYVAERTGTNVYEGKIGLLYYSEIIAPMIFKNASTGNDWLYTMFYNSIDNTSSRPAWIMTPNTANRMYSMDMSSYVVRAQYAYADPYVIPTLYLEPSLTIVEGTDGSSDNPFQLIGY